MHQRLPSFVRYSLATLCLALPVACSSSSSGVPGNGTADSGTSSTDSSTKTDGGVNGTTDSGGSTVTDSAAPVTDTGTVSVPESGPEDSSVVDTGTIMGTDASVAGLAGTYQCMLTGTATTNLGTQMLPFDGTMTVTVNGSAVTALLTADGGTNCTVDFTATSATMATVDANQTCVVPVTTPIMTTATLSFISPTGTATLSGTTITADMPFNVSAAGGIATGTGTLTGPCTKM